MQCIITTVTQVVDLPVLATSFGLGYLEQVFCVAGLKCFGWSLFGWSKRRKRKNSCAATCSVCASSESARWRRESADDGELAGGPFTQAEDFRGGGKWRLSS